MNKVITKDELATWVRSLRKIMKENGFNVSHSKNTNVIEIFQHMDKSLIKVPMKATVGLSNKMPTLLLTLNRLVMGDKNQIEPLKKEAITLFIQQFRLFIGNELGTDKLRMSIEYRDFNFSETNRLEIIQWFAETGLKVTQNGGIAEYLDDVSHSRFLKLVETQRGIEKSYQEEIYKGRVRFGLFDSTRSWLDIFEVKFKGVVDRYVKITASHEENNFTLNISSVHHKKTIKVDEISSELFEKEYEQFINEERFKGLLDGPKMNKDIDNSIVSLIGKMECKEDINKEQMFEELLTHFTLEEMVDLTQDPKKRNAIGIKNFKFTEQHYDKEGYITELYSVYKSSVISFWGKYIVTTTIEISGNETMKSKESKHYFIDKLFEAEKTARIWFQNNI